MIAQTFRACILLLPKIIVLALAAPRSLSLEFIAERAKQRQEAPGLFVSPWRFRVHPV